MHLVPALAWIAQALERNAHLRHPAIGDEPASGVKERIPRWILSVVLLAAASALAAPAATTSAAATATKSTTATASAAATLTTTATTGLRTAAHHRVGLDAVRVDGEDVCALMVEKRIEKDRDDVVAHGLVAVGPVRADLPRV